MHQRVRIMNKLFLFIAAIFLASCSSKSLYTSKAKTDRLNREVVVYTTETGSFAEKRKIKYYNNPKYRRRHIAKHHQ